MELFDLKMKEDIKPLIIAECLEFLSCNGGAELPIGRYEVNRDGIHVIISEYTTRPRNDGVWEAHRDYADLQVVLKGEENIYVSDLQNMSAGEYIKEKDFLQCEGEEDISVHMKGAEALLLLPEDAHMPNMCVGDAPTYVKKAVFKIPVHLCNEYILKR